MGTFEWQVAPFTALRCGVAQRVAGSISFLTKPASAFIHAPGRRHAGRKKSSIRRFFPPQAQRLRDSRARLGAVGAGRGAPPTPAPRARFILAARLGCRRCLRRLRLGALPRVAPRRLRLGVTPRALHSRAPRRLGRRRRRLRLGRRRRLPPPPPRRRIGRDVPRPPPPARRGAPTPSPPGGGDPGGCRRGRPPRRARAGAPLARRPARSSAAKGAGKARRNRGRGA